MIDVVVVIDVVVAINVVASVDDVVVVLARFRKYHFKIVVDVNSLEN